MLDDAFGLCQHLRFRNPQGSGGHGDGEVVDFDAVELVDAHLYGILEFTHHHLAVVAFTDCLVFKSTQT